METIGVRWYPYVSLPCTCTELLLDTWGFADIEAAVSSIPGWIAAKKWKGSNVNVNELYVSGHSNGGEHFQFQRLTTGATLTKSGQGTWFIMSHQPDKVVAAAPVSGYSSIQGLLNSCNRRII